MMFSRIAETMIAAPKPPKYFKYIQKQKRLCFSLNALCAAETVCCANRQQALRLDIACFGPGHISKKKKTNPPDPQQPPNRKKRLLVLSWLAITRSTSAHIRHNHSLTQGNIPSV